MGETPSPESLLVLNIKNEHIQNSDNPEKIFSSAETINYLFKVLRKKFGNQLQDNEIEDIIQTALTKAYRAYKKNNYDPQQSKLRSWLTTITIRETCSLLKSRKKYKPQANDPEETIQNIPDQSQNPENQTTTRERSKILHECIALLNDKLRIPLELHYFEERLLIKTVG